jgi:hypothetical protein
MPLLFKTGELCIYCGKSEFTVAVDESDGKTRHSICGNCGARWMATIIAMEQSTPWDDAKQITSVSVRALPEGVTVKPIM